MNRAANLINLCEGKQAGVLYHLVNQERMQFILATDSLKSKNYGGVISVTRSKHLSTYVGSDGMVLFRLALDGDKLSHKYKISPYRYISSTGVSFDGEAEEQIAAPNGITPLKPYLIEIQVIQSAYNKWKKLMDSPEDDFDKKQAMEFYQCMEDLHKYAKVRFI